MARERTERIRSRKALELRDAADVDGSALSYDKWPRPPPVTPASRLRSAEKFRFRSDFYDFASFFALVEIPRRSPSEMNSDEAS